MNNEHKKDAIFYKNVSYQNDKEYIKKLISMNISPSEISNKDILDYGCGTGDASFYFMDFSPSTVMAIDIGERNINFADKKKKEGKHENLELISADLNSFVLDKNKYDLIWSDTTIEFLRKPLDLIIEDFKMVLKPEGVCYFSFTKKCMFNILLYSVLKLIKIMRLEKFKSVFYYLILPKYYMAKLFNRNFEINHAELKNKINYLFIPHVRLISEKSILKILKEKGFKVLYIRERLKSDINSTPHLEVKAVNIAHSKLNS